MKKIWLSILILFLSILYIFFIPSEPKLIKVLFKLIPMWLIITYAFLQSPIKQTRTQWLLLIGLFFCMLGDGFIAYSFVSGLSAFLIGHLFYMAGFFSKWRFSTIRVVTIIPIGIYSFLIGKEIITSLIQEGNNGLIVPVLFYVIVISFMCWSAIMTGNVWAIIGSVLFVTSDSFLSWNMFVSDIPYSDVLIMGTYYSAQFLIAHSVNTINQ